MQVAVRLNPGERLGDRIIKVNHAGEHGAVSIYRAQISICRWRAPSLVDELTEFKEHEERHRSIFDSELKRRGVRRCRSYHLCGVGGALLGSLTALFGPAAVAATTVAVERVVLNHLSHQLSHLRESDPAAHAAVADIVAEERAHYSAAATLLS